MIFRYMHWQSVNGRNRKDTAHRAACKELMPFYRCSPFEGYGRKSRGFRIVNENDTAKVAGDEPLQMKKIQDLTVAVSSSRTKELINC